MSCPPFPTLLLLIDRVRAMNMGLNTVVSGGEACENDDTDDHHHNAILAGAKLRWHRFVSTKSCVSVLTEALAQVCVC